MADTHWPLFTLRQVHSDIIHRITDPTTTPLVGDGMVTNTPGIVLAIQTADCLPVILVDRKSRAVGVFHAGWRGTVKRIVEKGVGVMQRSFQQPPRRPRRRHRPRRAQLLLHRGRGSPRPVQLRSSPTEMACFHEVKESDPVREKYPMLFLTARAPGHSNLPVNIFLDLVEANRRQLLDAGVSARRIQTIPFCSACHTDLLFSHRTEQGQHRPHDGSGRHPPTGRPRRK